MTTDEVARLSGCALVTVQKWAAANGVAYTGRGNRKTYNFTEADIERFRQRPKPGRRWPAENARKSNS
jgi:DNA-binding transcriptional MerR regulator